LATAGDRGFVLHTSGGDVDFVPGVNLGSTTPSFQPGELAISAHDYRRWFVRMGELGVRAVRIYTIHPPSFYTELELYNRAHPDAPLYLVQGAYLPDESYVKTGDLYDPRTTAAFSDELTDASAAVHGDLQRGRTPGRASGTWRADVSPWLMSWVIGVEWDPIATKRSDDRNPGAPAHRGRYFTSTNGASPTERWLAARMDELAAAEARRGVSAPIAFANWPTTDPLRHPDEPLADEDLVGIDANNVRPTPAWPGGTFASYHAYPYYPDFQRHESDLAKTTYAGRPDPYAGYLQALRRHHREIPVMITEFGVPSSIGSAHNGPLGRDQGGHSETEAMRIDAELMRLIHDQGMAGAFVFSWTDEWFKRTWNTTEHQIPAERRQLWHDPLTNEQYFGILATDPLGPEGQQPKTLFEGTDRLSKVTARIDESYVHLSLRFTSPPGEPITVAVDTTEGGSRPPSGAGDATADYAFVLDTSAGSGQAWVRAALDPVRFDGLAPPTATTLEGWNRQRLLTNRPLRVDGRLLPAEYADIGVLRQGELDPGSPGYDSLATWQLDGETLELRVPWAMAGLADPSSRQALAAGVTPSSVSISGIGLTVALGKTSWKTDDLTWDPWQSVRYSERLKPGADALAAAFHDLASPK
jgi:hypothetical protein